MGKQSGRYEMATESTGRKSAVGQTYRYDKRAPIADKAASGKGLGALKIDEKAVW